VTVPGFDPETGVARAPIEELESLLAHCDELSRDSTEPRLAAAMEAAARPRCRLEVQRGGPKATCWVDPRAAALLVPREAGQGELWALEAGAVPAMLAGILGLVPRPPARAEARLPAAILAALLAGVGGQVLGHAPIDPWLHSALTSATTHWRVDSRWAGEQPPVVRSVEVIDSVQGLWLVTPDESDAVLVPAVTSELWRRLAGLFPRA